MKNVLSIIGFILLFVSGGRAQSVNSFTTNGPFINQLCPDFLFDTLINYKKEKLAISDLKGKFVIIDFWGTFCVPCINDIPKIEQLQKRYGDTMQILMVATDGLERATQFYKTRVKANKPMQLPCAINRRSVNYFQVKEVSTYVWIDDQGIIKAITDDSQITEKNVADFVNRKNVVFRQKEKEVKIDFKKYMAAVASEMDSSSVLYNSTLTKHLKGVRSSYFPMVKGRTRVYVTNMPASKFYQIAFGDSTGAVPFNRTVIESAHPEKIECPENEDFEVWKVNNTYCYELTVPKEKQKDILNIMQEELKRLFGLNVFREYRTQKCLILKKEKEPRFFADSNTTPKMAMSVGGVTVKNHPFSTLAELIQHYLQRKIVLDETGITGKIDVVLQVQMNDEDAVNAALKQYGLSLRYENRQVLMLVIKDPQ
ncbi:MAG TPA: redoxin domain-containing protein [Segetibacter sp.]|nr:redoxin domain-containing protein [Segetibacter sp.]